MSSFDQWLEYDGRIVNIGNHAYRLTCRERQALYPSRHRYMDVTAEMVDKHCPEYLLTRQELGDHWVRQILPLSTEESLETLCAIEDQLLPSKRPASLEPTLI
jgi:hypothetical protein